MVSKDRKTPGRFFFRTGSKRMHGMHEHGERIRPLQKARRGKARRGVLDVFSVRYVAESLRPRQVSSARRRMASAIPEKMTLWNG